MCFGQNRLKLIELTKEAMAVGGPYSGLWMYSGELIDHADEFCKFFMDKVAEIRAATAGAPAPIFIEALR